MLPFQECNIDPYNHELFILENPVTNQNSNNRVSVLNLHLKEDQGSLSIWSRIKDWMYPLYHL